MQDYLGLGQYHRMNTPGIPEGNWQWRLLPGEANAALAKKIFDMTLMYGRKEKQTEDTADRVETI